MEFKDEVERLNARYGMQELDIKVVGKNLISINGDLLRVKHNYGTHYGIKALDSMTKKERQNVLDYGSETTHGLKWVKDREHKLKDIEDIKLFLKNASTNPRDTYKLMEELDNKYNMTLIKSFNNKCNPLADRLPHGIFEGLDDENDETSIVKFIGSKNIAYKIQDYENFIIREFYY